MNALCPRTEYLSQVLPNGCMQNEKIELVRFDFDSDKLSAVAKTILDRLAKVIANYQDNTFLVQGHTDSLGDRWYNYDLSLRRAKAVKEYLVSAGVKKSQLRLKGEGESRPEVSNRDEAGRAINRRAVLVLD